MSLPASDAFTTGTNANLASYSANWTQNNGTFRVLASTDDVRTYSSDEIGAHWNADSFDNDQYSEGEINSLSASATVGVAVRVHASAATYYALYAQDTYGTYLGKVISGSWTELGNTGTTFSASDVIRLEAEGTAITPYRNGGVFSAIGAETDSSISSGYAGLSGWESASDARIDNWEGGNIASGYSLSLDAGSYSISGQAPSLLISRALSFDAGSYSVSGQTVSLLVSRTLDLGVGSYTVNGQDISLLVSRLLALGAGSYSVTGQDISLLVSRLLALDTGNYSITGQDISLLVSRALLLDAGSYSVSGQTVSLLVSRLLSLDAGAYTVTGNAASLLISRLLDLSAGSYTITGQSIAFSTSTVTQTERIYVILQEDRTAPIGARSYIISIANDDKIYRVENESRTYSIDNENRTFAAK